MSYTPEANMLMKLNEHSEVYRDMIRYRGENKFYADKLDRVVEVDAALLREYHAGYMSRKDMQVGDWARMKDGRYMQVTVSWDESFQAFGDGTHYCYLGKYTDYSGVCGDSYNKADFVLTDTCKPGNCWFFHEGHAGGGRGVQAVMPFKVWQQI
jgi:hypothetical protein